ncbi:MerR family transcriptional regulator [Kistimonas scapharcae]|uniref:MerR family transcriptional regulator n=1 Tax=Kistimonas scapharcae TaxID=1036133 RepID=A0ABP8VAX6_9GAMM
MYLIAELAEHVSLSRSTLLYYEKQGLIAGKRQANGYRIYSEKDAQRLRLIQKLQAGGLTLKECKACLNSRVDRSLLLKRLQQLDDDIAQKQQSRQLLAAMLGEGELKAWHQSLDKVAPDAHLEWLMNQGFTQKEALRLKWLSKDMNTHEQYMNDFMRVFEALDRWGPGSEKDTLEALAKVPFEPARIMDIGCGKGIATTLLAAHTSAHITAVDNDEPALARLVERARGDGVLDSIETICVSMTDLSFDEARFDLIWAEGSAYIMGVANAFTQWQKFLEPKGVLVLSDLVWLNDAPSQEALTFWQQEYPDMTTVARRVEQANEAGYTVIDTFSLSEESWQSYIKPLEARVNALRSNMPESAALRDIETELNIYRQYLGEFGYQMFVLQKTKP